MVVLSVLVVIHELGHYCVARWCGVKVLRFSVGFGRIVWSRRYGPDRTEWALSAVPLGGYVKMADEREGDIAPVDVPRAFNRQSVGKRIAIVAAGPIANLLLAVLLFAGTFVAGVPGQRALLAEPRPDTPAAAAGIHGGDLVVAVDGAPVKSWQDLRWRLLKASGHPDAVLGIVRAADRDKDEPATRVLSLAPVSMSDWEGNFMPMLGLAADFGEPLIDEVIAGKPADRAGLKAGDHIVAIDGEAVHSPADVAARTNAKPGVPVTFRVARDGAPLDVVLTPEASDQAGRRVGLAGLRLKIDPAAAQRLGITVRYGPVEALGEGARKTYELSVFTLKMLASHRHRRRVAQEPERPDHARRLCRTVGASGRTRLHRVSRAHQHQSRRAQPAADSAVGWGSFAVLFRGTHQGQSRFRPRLRDRPANRHGCTRGNDGAGAFQ